MENFSGDVDVESVVLKQNTPNVSIPVAVEPRKFTLSAKRHLRYHIYQYYHRLHGTLSPYFATRLCH